MSPRVKPLCKSLSVPPRGEGRVIPRAWPSLVLLTGQAAFGNKEVVSWLSVNRNFAFGVLARLRDKATP